jgi:predicted nucleic acid-binding protein
MSALVLDTGALVAIDRGDRSMLTRLKVAERMGLELRSTGVVVAEAWRDPRGRQANLARLLKSVNVFAVDQRLGRRAGELLGESGMRDAVDATVVAISATGDSVVTSDPVDIGRLVTASARAIRVVSC